MTVAIRASSDRVWSAAPYFNETDTLRIKIREQRSSVDVFAFCEARWTYAGTVKPMTCWDTARVELGIPKAGSRSRRAWAEPLLDPAGALIGRILRGVALDGTELRVVELEGEPPGDYVTLQDFPNQWHLDDAKRRWQRENFQRAMLGHALLGAADRDVIVLSDLDEIVSARLIDFYVASAYNMILQPALPLHVGALNWRWQEAIPVIARIFRGNRLAGASPEDLRRAPAVQVFPAEVAWARHLDDFLSAFGWHLSYLGGVDAMRYKIEQAAHPELETSDALLEAQLERGLDLFGRTYKVCEWVSGAALPSSAADFPHLMVARP